MDGRRHRWQLLSWELVFFSLGFWLAKKPVSAITVLLLTGLGFFGLFSVLNTSVPLWVAVLSLGVLLILSLARFFWLYFSVKPLQEAEEKRWKGVFFSRILPGLGHLLTRRWLGILFLPLFIIGLFALEILGLPQVLAVPAALVLYALPVWHIGQGGAKEGKLAVASLGGFVIAFVLFSSVAQISAGLMKERLLEVFYIPSGAMTPTLKKKVYILVDKRDFEVKRWDIVVYTSAAAQERYGNPSEPVKFVSRVVGMPGDTVEYDQEDRFWLNGEICASPPGVPEGDYSITPKAFAFREVIIRRGEKFTVPPGMYYLMSDKPFRADSGPIDSRECGPVDRREILGKAVRIWWPPAEARVLTRE